MDSSIFNHFFEYQFNKLAGGKLQYLYESFDRDLYTKIYNRFVVVLGSSLIRVLLPEYNLFKEKNKSENEILELFCEYIDSEEFNMLIADKYPEIEKIILNNVSDGIDYIIEVYKNFEKERNKIEQNLDCKLGKVLDIILWQGDIHNGKSASKLIAENGCIYYKPVGGGNIKLFYKIVDFLLKDTDIGVKRTRIYSTDKHMWMEEAKYQTCTSINEVKEYYFISGVYLFAFYTLGTYDMHHENIISNGSTPIIVDFETLSLLPMNNSNTNFKDLLNSVLNTMFIPFISDKGVFDINISGILSHTEISRKSEYYDYEISKEEGIKIEKKNTFVQIINQVSLNGEDDIFKFISLEEIRNILRDGFLYAGNIVLNSKDKFIAMVTDFSSENYMEFRQILRPTEVYHQFVEACKHPSALMSSKKMDEILMLLYNNFKPTSFGYLRVEEEVKEMKKGYIPRFYTLYDSKTLCSNGKIICKDYYPISVQESFEKKINLLDLNQLNYQMNLIDFSILSLVKKEHFGITTINRSVGKNEFIDSQYVKEAVLELIKRFRFMEITYEGGFSTVVAPHLSEKVSMWSIKEMSCGLYEYGGIVLLFAYFGHVYSDFATIDFSLRLLDYFNIVNMKNSSNPNLSVFAGEGSLIYINYCIYRLLSKIQGYEKKSKQYMEKYLEIRNNALEIVSNKDIRMTDFDYTHGMYTSIYLISKICLNENTGETEVLKKLENIKNLIVDTLDVQKASEIGFAHGITGNALILSALYRLFPDDKLLLIIRNLIIKENILIDKEGIFNMRHIWCRGTTGIMLGRNMIYENIYETHTDADTINIIQKYNKFLFRENVIEEMLRLDNLCMCHGIYGNIEILNKFKQKNRHEHLLKKRYFESFSDLNWIHNQIDISIDTFMLGNLGIAYTLLELVSNDVPAMMSLDIR